MDLLIFKLHKDKYVKSILKKDGDYKENLRKIIRFSAIHGFYGNLWHDYLAYCLLMDENPLSLSCEVNRGVTNERINELATEDMKEILKLFKKGDENLEGFPENGMATAFNETMKHHICELGEALAKAENAEKAIDILKGAYKKYGVGKLGLHKAFRLTDEGEIEPITRTIDVFFDDIIGYEDQKKSIRENTEAFVAGRPANNCLLYGHAGTGKSTTIKAVANEYYKDGLRIVEVYRHQFKFLHSLVSKVKDRGYKFIIYMDDLSFEESETEYKYLKAVIEGGLEKKPDNILIYATSNRRHLVRESFENRNDDINMKDSMQEKVSLSSRFGLSIFYGEPSKNEYNEIVLGLREKYGMEITEEDILKEANIWAMSHSGRSGRGAEQLINYLRGTEKQ